MILYTFGWTITLLPRRGQNEGRILISLDAAGGTLSLSDAEALTLYNEIAQARDDLRNVELARMKEAQS